MLTRRRCSSSTRRGAGGTSPPRDGDESIRNPGEAECVVRTSRALLDAGLDPTEVAVISPYAAQVALLRELASSRGLSPAVEIDTIDAFQGREKDAVLLSTVRSNADGQIGFLRDLRRMNVAITRARRHLFVVGDGATLARDDYYQAFIDHAESLGGYRSAWSWPGADEIA